MPSNDVKLPVINREDVAVGDLGDFVQEVFLTCHPESNEHWLFVSAETTASVCLFT